MARRAGKDLGSGWLRPAWRLLLRGGCGLASVPPDAGAEACSAGFGVVRGVPGGRDGAPAARRPRRRPPARRRGLGATGAGAQAADDRQGLVADPVGGRGVAGLDVQPEQRLGVGGADVEPPVVGGDGQSVELVEGDALAVLVGRLDRGEPAGLVVDGAVDLAGGRVAVVLRDQLRRAGRPGRRGPPGRASRRACRCRRSRSRGSSSARSARRRRSRRSWPSPP